MKNTFADTPPGERSEGEADAGRVEQRKAMNEFFRHLMTLDGAALVLVATLVEKVFGQPVARPAVVVSVGGFLFSLFCGGIAYLMAVVYHPRVGALRMSSGDKDVFAFTAVFTLGGFLVGIGGLTWFFLANWLR